VIRLLILATCLAVAGVSRADPWLAPGDEALRHDIALLADAGILRGPSTTWPMSWPDIARDVRAAGSQDHDEATAAALVRVQRLATDAASWGFSGIGIRARAAHSPGSLRTFVDTPREEGELGMRASWLGDHVAVNLQGAVTADPSDDKQFRPDGSYLGINVGNFMLSAGYMERWWGPGWEGSLILSTNARPIPSVTLERNYTDPFKSPWLRWIGPWRASIAIGEAESHDVAVPHVRFLAARVNFRPRPWLDVGLTRTAQWCGGERECGWSTFTNLLIGRDNQVTGGAASVEQPGNQMAGYDIRLRSPWRALPLSLYTQWIGEDEAGGLPAKFMGLAGAEIWGNSAPGGYRIHAEYADTACNFTRENPLFGCGYRNSIYPQGYAYRQRLIGHSMDNDSRMYSVGAILVRPDGDSLSLLARKVELNRDGGEHFISAVPVDLSDVEFRYSRHTRFGKFSLGAGYQDPAVAADEGQGLRGFLTWQQGF
jgi:hypothetical protein